MIQNPDNFNAIVIIMELDYFTFMYIHSPDVQAFLDDLFEFETADSCCIDIRRAGVVPRGNVIVDEIQTLVQIFETVGFQIYDAFIRVL